MKGTIVCFVVLLFSINVLVVHSQTNYTNGAWKQIKSLFGAEIPFRLGHVAAMTDEGNLISFGGRDNFLASVKQVAKFDYIIRDVNTIPDGEIRDIVNVKPLEDSSKDSRQNSAFGRTLDEDLILYGGDLGGSPSKDIYIFNRTANDWADVEVSFSGDISTEKENHFAISATGPAGCVDDNNNFYIFGGTANVVLLNFLTRFDISTYTFYQLEGNGADSNFPSRKQGAVIAWVADYNGDPTIWVFGGKAGLGQPPNVQDPQTFNELNAYNLATSSWISTGSVTGTAPAARSFAASAVLKDGVSWVIFGGKNENNFNNPSVFTDLHIFNMEVGAWVLIDPSGVAPAGRDKFVAVACRWTGEDSILFYGGSAQDGSALNEFWKWEYASAQITPNDPPVIPGQDITDVVTPPASSSVESSQSQNASSEQPIAVQSSPASILCSWLNLIM